MGSLRRSFQRTGDQAKTALKVGIGELKRPVRCLIVLERTDPPCTHERRLFHPAPRGQSGHQQGPLCNRRFALQRGCGTLKAWRCSKIWFGEEVTGRIGAHAVAISRWRSEAVMTSVRSAFGTTTARTTMTPMRLRAAQTTS